MRAQGASRRRRGLSPMMPRLQTPRLPSLRSSCSMPLRQWRPRTIRQISVRLRSSSPMKMDRRTTPDCCDFRSRLRGSARELTPAYTTLAVLKTEAPATAPDKVTLNFYLPHSVEFQGQKVRGYALRDARALLCVPCSTGPLSFLRWTRSPSPPPPETSECLLGTCRLSRSSGQGFFRCISRRTRTLRRCDRNANCERPHAH